MWSLVSISKMNVFDITYHRHKKLLTTCFIMRGNFMLMETLIGNFSSASVVTFFELVG